MLLEVARCSIRFFLRSHPAFRGNHRRVRRHEQPAYIHRAVEQTARVVAQIEHERLHSFAFQLGEFPVEIGGGRLAELHDARIADFEIAGFIAQNPRVLDARHFNDRALDNIVFDLLRRGTQDC